MKEKRFHGDIARLRAPERVARLQVHKVVDLCLEGASIRNVLDVGTGSGLFAEAFAGRGLVVAGLDENPDMLGVARNFVPGGDFKEGSAEVLPFQNDAFDLVFLGLVLHESDEPLTAVREAMRVSSRRVCILEWPHLEQPSGPPLAHRLSPADFAGLFRDAGVERSTCVELEQTVLYILEK